MKHAAILLSLLALAGCAQPGPGGATLSNASPATRAACRTRADEAYGRQNRADIYRDDAYVSGARDAPFATTSVYGEQARSLSSRYGRDKLVDDCVRGVAGNVGANTAPEPVPVPVK